MPQREHAGDVRRRNDDRVGGLGRSRVGEKVAVFQPPGIPFLFDRAGFIGFRKCRHGGSILRKNAPRSTGFWHKFRLQRQETTLNLQPSVRYVLVSLILLLWASVCQAEWNVVICDNRRYVPIDDVATFYKMNQPVSIGERFRLAAPGRSIEGVAGGRDVHINGVKYVLCFPIVSRDGRTLISAMDVVKIIEPILRPQKIKNPGTVKTVILDAGHGGLDSGATGPFGKEKDAALDVVLRAKKLFQENGYQVRSTRLSDTFIPLGKTSTVRQPPRQRDLR